MVGAHAARAALLLAIIVCVSCATDYTKYQGVPRASGGNRHRGRPNVWVGNGHEPRRWGQTARCADAACRGRKDNGQYQNVHLYGERWATASGSAVVSSSFISNIEGWSTVWESGAGTGWQLSHDAGGAVATETDEVQARMWYFYSPSSFSGDRSSAYNGKLQYTLSHKSFRDHGKGAVKSSCTANRDCNGPSDIVLEAECGYSLVKKGAFSGSGMSETVEVTLNEDSGWRDTRTGKKASLFDFLGVLSHLKAVWVRGSYYTGTESTRISDVKITAGKKWEPCCTLDDTIDICNNKGNRYFNPSNLKFYCEGSQANQVRVTSVFPRYGRRTGGSTVTVEGHNFGQDGTTPIVRVGGRKCKKTYFPTHQPLPAMNTIVRENKIDCTSPPTTSLNPAACTHYRVWLDQEASPEPNFYVGMMIKIGTDYRRITRYHHGEKATSASNGNEGTEAGTGAAFNKADKYIEVDQPFSSVHTTDTTVYTIYYVPPFGNAWRARPLRASQVPTAYDSSSFDGYDSFAHDGNVGNPAGVNVRETLHSGTAQDGAAGTIQLAVGAVTTDDYYNGWTITLTSGSGYFAGGVTRTIVDYVGSSKTASVDRNWEAPPGGTPVAPTSSTTYALFRDGAGDNGDLGANAETSRGPKQHTRVVCVTPEFSGNGQPFDNDVTVEAYAGGREGPFRVQALGHGRTGSPSGRFATSATSCVNEESRGFEYGEHDFRWSVHMRSAVNSILGGAESGQTTVHPMDMAIDHNNGEIYTVGNVKTSAASENAKIFVEGLHVDKGYPVDSAVSNVDDFTTQKLYMSTDKAANGGQAGFIAKFSKTGTPLWITYGKSDATTDANQKVWFDSVTVDYTGNTGAATAATADVYVSGRYQGSLHLHHVDKSSADRVAGKDRPSATAVQVQAFAGIATAVGVAGDEATDLRGFLAKYDGAGQITDTQGIYNAAADKNLHASSKVLVRSYRASASHIINDYENGGVYVTGQIAADGTATDWTFGKFKAEYQNGGQFKCDVRVNSAAVDDASDPTHYAGTSADCDDDGGLSNNAGWLAKYDKNLKVDWVRAFQLSASVAGAQSWNADATKAGVNNAYSIVALAVHGDAAYVTGARGTTGDTIVTKAISTRKTDPDKGYGMGQRGAAWESQPNWKRHEQGVVGTQTAQNKVAIDLTVTQPSSKKGLPLTQAIGRPGWLIRVKGNPEGHDMDDITAASTNQDNIYTTGPPHPGTGGTQFGDNVRRITAVAYIGDVVTYTVDSNFEKAPTCTVQNHGGASGKDIPQAGKEKVCDLYELWDPQPRAYVKWSMQAGKAADGDNELAVQALAYADPELAPPALRGNWQHWDTHETLLARHQPNDYSAPHDVRSENSFSDPAAPGAYVYISGILKGSGTKGFCHYDAVGVDQTSACLRAAFPVECKCGAEDETKNGQPVSIKRCNRASDLGIGASKPPCNGEIASVNDAGDSDLFIAKYDANSGALLWVKRTGEPLKNEVISSMAVDWKTGGVYITGDFVGAAQMDCGVHATSACGTDNFGLIADSREDELGCPMDTRPEESCFDTDSADFDSEYCKLRSRGKPWCMMIPHKASQVTGFLLKVTDGVRAGRSGAVAQRGRVKTTSHGYMSSTTDNCYTAAQTTTATNRKCGSDGMLWAKVLGLSRCAGTGACTSKGVTVQTRDTDVYVLGHFTAIDDGLPTWAAMRTPGVDDLGFSTYHGSAQDGVLYKLED